MRTRSQQASPGGFVSLDTERPLRRTRSTRAASQQSASQSSTSEQTTESSTQPVTRSQRTKKTTTKKTTTATAATIKTQTETQTESQTQIQSQTRKAPKRATRKTTRKTDNLVSGDQVPEPVDEERADNTKEDEKENPEVISDKPESDGVTSDTAALLEPKSSERESQSFIPPSPTPEPIGDSQAHDAAFDLPEDLAFGIPDDLVFDLPEDLSRELLELYDGIDNINITENLDNNEDNFSLPSLGETPCPAWYDLDSEELAEVGYTLSERSDSPSIIPNDGAWAQDFQLDDDLAAQIDAVLALHDAQESGLAQAEEHPAAVVEENGTPTPVDVNETTVNQAVPNTSEQEAVAEPTSTEPKDAEQSKDEADVPEEPTEEKADSPLASDEDSEEKTAVEDKLIDELAQAFEKLSLVDVVPCLSEEAAVASTESTTTLAWLPETELASNNILQIASSGPPAFVSGASVDTPSMASIYSDVPPSFPTLELLVPAKRVQQRSSTIFRTPVPDSPSSIWEGGRAPASVALHERQQIVERPLAPVVLEEEPELIPGPPVCPSRVTPRERRQAPRGPTRRILRRWASTPLSPIPEERGRDPSPSSSVGTGLTITLPLPEMPPMPPSPLTPPVAPMPPVPPALPKAITQDASSRTRKKKKLTSKKVNRKRAHAEVAPEHQQEPETPSANKRRNLGPPGSTPYARRITPLPRRISANVVPYSERLRRRQAESQGRIHRTVFRLPQLVAQTEADRRRSETSSMSPCPEPLNMNLNFPVDQGHDQDQEDEQKPLEQPAVLEAPSTPEPSQRGWNFRRLFNSVPRSFSRFIPSFRRTPETPEASATQQQPSSERVHRTQISEANSTIVAQKESSSRRRSSEQPPAKRARNLSYSLFPAPIDRSLYLGDIPSKTPKSLSSLQAPATKLDEQAAIQQSESQNSTSTSLNTRGRDSTPVTGTASEKKQNKRKRSPSPDVIPNPAGSSYGMDLDYFCYSSESDDEAELPAPQTEPRKTGTLANDTVRGIIQSERPASKKVRFDASPEDTPSKLRLARATDPYRGQHFIGMGGPQNFSSPTTPTTPTPASHVSQPLQRPPGFIPNTQGTFQLDYDAFSDDSESSEAPSPPNGPASTAETESPASTQPSTPASVQLPGITTTPRPLLPPSTPAKVDEEALARARSQAEKYKPKTPSGLRTASRYSSPLTATTPDTTPGPTTENSIQKFGDDQFAEDAQWLYENCPSGDLSQLVWPAPQSLAESLNVSPTSVQIVSDIWDDSDIDRAYAIWKHGLTEFKKTLA